MESLMIISILKRKRLFALTSSIIIILFLAYSLLIYKPKYEAYFVLETQNMVNFSEIIKGNYKVKVKGREYIKIPTIIFFNSSELTQLLYSDEVLSWVDASKREELRDKSLSIEFINDDELMTLAKIKVIGTNATEVYSTVSKVFENYYKVVKERFKEKLKKMFIEYKLTYDPKAEYFLGSDEDLINIYIKALIKPVKPTNYAEDNRISIILAGIIVGILFSTLLCTFIEMIAKFKSEYLKININ